MTTTTITTAELRQRRSNEAGLRLIDVRTGAEFESAHIPGSYNVPLETLNDHARDIAAVDGSIILVCQSGLRASHAQESLVRQGQDSSVILDGGMNAWQMDGGDVSHGAKTRWAMDRQVRLVAGSLALGGIVASIYAPKAKWLSAGIGTGLLFSAVTNTCTMGDILGKLPYNNAEPCDIEAVLGGLENAGVDS